MAAKLNRASDWKPMGLLLADKACLSNQSCYIIHCLLNADDNPTGGSLKLKTESSTVHTRMVNAKTFGCNSRMGDSEGDSRDTIVDCWKEAPVEEMLEATSNCTFERALKRGREGFIVAFAVTGIEYWVLSKIWDDPTIIGHQPR